MRFTVLAMLAIVLGIVSENIHADVTVVMDRKATAVLVVSKSPYPVVSLAAREFQHHVKKATGVELLIVAEDQVPAQARCRIYLGNTRAAREAGIDAAQFPRDTYRIFTQGTTAYLVGGDGDGDPLHKSLSTPCGTLFAVYDVMDNDLQVRWLWPGELGEVVPSVSTFRIRSRDITVQPRFRFCGLRTRRPDEILWLRRMRFHAADGMRFGHAFGDWGARYGQEHPDWFEMDSQGIRHPGWSMCVSNPELHKQIVENWWAEQQTHPELRTTVNVCENDRNGDCRCPNCLAWDGPEAPKPRPSYYENSHNVSQRYARFAVGVLKLAREKDPKAEVTCYAYLNYAFAPDGIKIDPGVIAGFVADVFYPRTQEDHEWVKRQWQGWYDSGASLFLRPNYLLNGYSMPENWARQFADEWKFCEERGMIGTDFDSLNGQWGSQGPILYSIGRLHAKPEMPIEKILDEYYAGFGPAAKYVKAYWEYWERYTREHTDVLQDGTAHWTIYPKVAYQLFPPACFEPAEKLLSRAETATLKDPSASARVAFLRTALTHSRLCSEASLAMAGTDKAVKNKALRRLYAFRKKLTDPYVVNVDFNFYSCKDREKNVGWPE